MLEEARSRLTTFQTRLQNVGIPCALITNEASIAYLAGFWGYLSIEFGRPTFLLVFTDADPIVITPRMESEMVAAMTWVEDVRGWDDDGQETWHQVLRGALGERRRELGVELDTLPAVVRRYFDDAFVGLRLLDAAPELATMRTVKSRAEIDVMRTAGRIGKVMMVAAEAAVGDGVPEYHAALAAVTAGTHAASGFLTARGWEAFVSPMIHNLQIMQSGTNVAMVHRRVGVRTMRTGDPVYFCFCNMLEFKHYRLGFDRMFHIGHVAPDTERAHETAIAAQQAALGEIRPGAIAEDIARAANDVYQTAGYAPSYRTGRSIGIDYLEAPELKIGDRTELQTGMTFAVDGGVTVPGRTGGRIGDSVVVTETGFDFLTEYPRDVRVIPT